MEPVLNPVLVHSLEGGAGLDGILALPEHRVVVLPQVDKPGTMRPREHLADHLEGVRCAAGEHHLVLRCWRKGREGKGEQED